MSKVNQTGRLRDVPEDAGLSGRDGTLARAYRMLEGHVATLTRDLDIMAAHKDAELIQKQQLAKRFQTLIEVLPGGVVVLNARGLVVQSNPAARRMLGRALDGQRWRDLIVACFAPRSDDGLEITTVTGMRISLATASLGGEGQIILLTDQTQTRELQRRVSHSERLSAMGKMVSALAHQVRTPLSAALLYADHLTNAALTESQRQVFSGKLQSRLRHMERQVRDMLLFVRQQLPLNDLISLAELESGLRDASEVVMAGRCQCRWINELPSEQIRCNREALISAVMNLIDNALQASDQQASLEVRIAPVAAEPDKLAVAVTDNGKGMSPKELTLAQETFYTSKSQGTGLGLAVVRSVATAHGGEFRLESQAGEGCCAVLYLPRLFTKEDIK